MNVATTVPGETFGEMMRRGLFRLLRAEVTAWHEVVAIGRAEANWTQEMVDWLDVAIREAIARGEVEQIRYPGGERYLRLTEAGLRTQGVLAALAITVPLEDS